jgi:hypothetical protein
MGPIVAGHIFTEAAVLEVTVRALMCWQRVQKGPGGPSAELFAQRLIDHHPRRDGHYCRLGERMIDQARARTWCGNLGYERVARFVSIQNWC